MKHEIQMLSEQLQNVRLEVEGAIAIVTMARPKAMNALNNQTLGELESLFHYFKKDKDILGVIITGEGKAFVAGADISQMNGYNAEQGREYADYAQSIFNKIEALEKPVIAAVNGYALGGGCELSMSCDIRIASDKAVFGQPEVNLGVIPCFGGTQRLSRLVGTGIAKELIYTARNVKAEEAKSIGLVNKVVPAESLLDEAKAMMQTILSKAPLAVRYAKIAINEGEGFKIAMAALDGGRIGMASQAVGIAEGAIDLAVAYAKERVQFKKPISANQGIQWYFADIATSTEAAKMLTLQAADLRQRGQNIGKLAAMAKYYASENAVTVTNKALQIHGGYGYMKEYAIERMYRDARITTLYEGTSEVQKMVISRAVLS